jgi:hypothetical protein
LAFCMKYGSNSLTAFVIFKNRGWHIWNCCWKRVCCTDKYLKNSVFVVNRSFCQNCKANLAFFLVWNLHEK